MSAKRLIVESAVKAALKEASGLDCISTEAVEWVNMQASCAVSSCAVHGRRTPGGRLMAPETTIEVLVGPIKVQYGGDEAPRADGTKRPERLDARAKEFAALSPEQQAEHLHKLYVQAPAINQEAIDFLTYLVENSSAYGFPTQRALEIIAAAKELQP